MRLKRPPTTLLGYKEKTHKIILITLGTLKKFTLIGLKLVIRLATSNQSALIQSRVVTLLRYSFEFTFGLIRLYNYSLEICQSSKG